MSTILRKNGAAVLTYPSAFAFSTGQAHWEQLLRARAIENQCYVVAAAQIGFHNAKRQSYGHAMVVDPWGKVLVECDDDPERVQCVTASIDLTKMDDVRQRMPCFEHRRSDVYVVTPVQIIDPSKSLLNGAPPLQPAVEAEPYFTFEKNHVPKSTIFYETPSCVAFTNITCVVPGREFIFGQSVALSFLNRNASRRYLGGDQTLRQPIERSEPRGNRRSVPYRLQVPAPPRKVPQDDFLYSDGPRRRVRWTNGQGGR